MTRRTGSRRTLAETEPEDAEALDTNVLDVSDVITDSERMREPTSEAARAVMQEARLSSGTIKTLSQGRSDLFRMNPFDLHIKPGWNVAREMDDPETIAHIDWLARDITNVGVQQPYRVYHENGRYYITDGHLRQHAVFRAMNKYGAKIMSVPVVLGPPGETDQDRTLMMLRANSSLNLKPWGKGAIMKRLVGWGWSERQIADEFHCSRNRVRQLLELQTLPDSMVGFIRKGIAADHVMTTFKALGEARASVELGSEVVYAKAIGAKRIMPKHGREARLGPCEDQPQANLGKTNKLHSIVQIIRRFTVTTDGDRWMVSMSVEDGQMLAQLTGMDVPEVDDSPAGPSVPAMVD